MTCWKYVITTLLGALLFVWGVRLGRLLVRKGATANDLFKGHASLSLAFLGLYVGLVVLALNVPQLQALPLEWRFYGMRVTWALLRITLLGACGVALVVSWSTARVQVIAVVLIGLLGLVGFSGAEAYFLSPIYASLNDDLQANGVFRQTSNSSCAPAALATVLRRWQIPATESSVARLAGTSNLGTSMPQLIVAAQELGLDGLEVPVRSWEQIEQINRPGVLAVWLFDEGRKLPHAIALLAMSPEFATIGDPSAGKLFNLSRAEFDLVWRRQYVAIFHPDDTSLTHTQAAGYLHRLGYLSSPQPLGLAAAIRRFQQDQGLAVSGELDPPTVLLLSGPFLQGVPTLRGSRWSTSAQG
ncbi:cysteine peptidase family C39 domain-containing protein [Leptolyngbya sp. FACHB-261]|uniref:cysteine peptidase family C39 domain-containing protein n=1 Tax=Leptolyngbya sp. FACHB-261 TaxID=2692806 RepID=UPI0016882287|nr:cysteine peptidase family C39 domain-containing protein [Leptolyngbya sp. FACHB-261]MBD2100926.1 peptidoglycan-binding protein [Leptolyngbya sp. FACHB-261]